MPLHPDNDPTAPPSADPSVEAELTRSYVPSSTDEAELSASERATRLRLTGGGASQPNAEETSLTRVDRYAIVREIGRGGMGIVYEADDPELRRHLAVKVMQESNQHDAVLVRRFLDEARICGQLQHPGIVPIHEIGRLPDQRPFFTMKLVQGQTLASLLQARQDPTDDLPRLLTIFEQVCQTMAYAHAHGIIHRDLKPSNLMVGNFGEVQVMDWGLAKVLTSAIGCRLSAIGETENQGSPQPTADSRQPTADPRGDAATSLAGTVMGTPGYMAPEQARGDSNHIDARCDVFGLGGLLCVILTGKPPYDGATHAQVYRQAMEADLSGALARLETCSADPELTALARECLAARPEDRPPDAGIVALKITNYHASVAERLRSAELERAAAQARAAGERKARRLTLALATTMIALLLLGASGWYWLEHERTEKRKLMGRAVEEHVQQAQRLRVKGQAAPSGELTPWIEALANAQAAVEQLSPEADPVLRAGVEQLRDELATEVRDRRMLVRLETIRLNKTDLKDNSFDVQGAACEYVAAFQEYGIDVEHLSDEQAAERIRGRAIAAELAAALDDWGEAADDAAMRKRFLEVARQADTDPWRQRLRAALAERDRDALAEMARSGDVAHLPPTTLFLLGKALAEVGDPVESIRLLRRAQARYPDDFWLNFQLGLHCSLSKPPQPDDALRYYTAAVALRKNSAGARLSLGNALRAKNALDEAVAEFRRAIELQPDFATAHYNLANVLDQKGQREQAIAEYREAIRLKSDYVEAYNNMGNALAALERLEESCGAYRQAVKLKPNHASAHHNLALSLMRRNLLDEALAACQEAVRHEGNAGYYNTLGQIHEKKHELEEAITAYRKAIELDANYPPPHYNLGLAYIRQGARQKGLAEIQKSLQLRPKNAPAWFDLGTTLLNQGKHREAIDALRKAVEIDPKYVKGWLNLGTALADIGRLDAAIDAYQQAVRVDPLYRAAWTSLGATYERKGDFNSAIEAHRKEVELAPNDADAHNSLGTVLAQRGRLAEAVAEFRTAIRLRRDFAQAYNNLGNALGAQGELPEAIEAYQTAVSIKPDYSRALWNQAQILEEWGKLNEAIAACRKALEIEPDDGWINCLLGLLLLKCGKLAEAHDALERGHQLGVQQRGWNRPSERWLNQTAQFLELDRKLPAIREGKDKPASVQERLDLAFLCLRAHSYYADAARLYREAFTTRPESAEDPATRDRYRAARAAALAGCGQGQGADKLTEAERAAWREQALDWLRGDLKLLRTTSERGSEVLRGSVRKKLRRWQQDLAFAGLRDSKAVEKLPEEEREACRQFWDEVKQVLETTTPAR